ncbi:MULTISPECIES: RraA family protein [unclassified Streptomyces]|uniref:RraA family protein n=1 Tax=unclassified Streptomyces TaxID=2593676 RepID=UPI0037AFCB49
MSTVFNESVRPSTEVDALRRLLLPEYSPSCLAADAGDRIGAIGGLRTVTPTHKIVGPALTIDLPENELVDILPVLGLARPGDVVVLACHGITRMAMWGGLMTTLSQLAGIAGAVVDGAVRDVDEIRDLDFPVWYRTAMPRRCPPDELEGVVQVNVPVSIDGVTVRPGDIVVADENGVAVVPPDAAAEVASSTQQLLEKERTVRDLMNAGATLPELLARFGHL